MKGNKKLELYKVKDIYLGYITTINKEALIKEDRFQKDVIALKRTKNEKGLYVYTQIGESQKYYTSIKKINLANILNRGGFVTGDTILKIVEQERQKEQSRDNIKNFVQLEEENTIAKRQDITLIQRELDINKTKHLVA